MKSWHVALVLATCVIVIVAVTVVVVVFVLKSSVACEPTTITLCEDHIDYNSTVFPNNYASSESDARSKIGAFRSLMSCHNQSLYFACALYTPKCVNEGEYILPCMSLCEEIRRVCTATKEGVTFDVDCSELTDDYVENVCIGGTAPKSFGGTCNSTEYQCANGQCLPDTKYRCDDTTDCLDGSDEVGCTCAEYRLIACESGNECIDPHFVCDGAYDCTDKSDEWYCISDVQSCSLISTDYTRCSNDAGCIYEDWLCDGVIDCADKSDESACDPCATGLFKCGDGTCITDDQLCNGYPECNDDSDENGCSNSTCVEGTFQCDNGWCVIPSWVCDDYDDCGDNSDEATAICGTCTSSQFRCDDGSCVTSGLRCDGNNDCADNSDEDNCGACEENQFTCNDGGCEELTVQCDGTDDCTDGSDELVCECGTRTMTGASTRVVGGVNANLGDWPWQVSLQSSVNGIHFCGGALVAPDWVLTAAHCFDESRNPSNFQVQVGITQLATWAQTGTRQERTISQVIVHPSYDTAGTDYDIALMQLSSPVQLNDTVRLACLPTSIMEFDVGKYCVVTGWGLTDEDGSESPYVLQEASVPLMSNAKCALKLDGVTTRMFCAGYPQGGVDSCQGDSGGPLSCYEDNKWYVAGVVSWGIGCARPNKPGVYTKVSYFADWINEYIT
ncbi:suppressor of tumorigenicity 14 protein-like [Ptychodera flava]|uniref:suppressor of tumorigenicity 14 protein-like n=1 Tax=Ptychodera flava TaxID=63121 RepID=UPI00396A2BF7